MNVGMAMSTPVLSVEPGASILDAAKLMLDRHVSGLPVIDAEGKLRGIVSEADFLRRGEIGTQKKQSNSWLTILVSPARLADEYIREHGRRVDEIMRADVVTTTPDAPLADAVRLMLDHAVKRLPVLEAGKVVGILTRSDLMRALANAATAEHTADDSAIAQQIDAELRKQAWGSVGTLDIGVKDGIVEIAGPVYSESERQALRVLVENVPGVHGISDHRVFIEPISGTVIPELS